MSIGRAAVAPNDASVPKAQTSEAMRERSGCMGAQFNFSLKSPGLLSNLLRRPVDEIRLHAVWRAASVPKPALYPRFPLSPAGRQSQRPVPVVVPPIRFLSRVVHVMDEAYFRPDKLQIPFILLFPVVRRGVG